MNYLIATVLTFLATRALSLANWLSRWGIRTHERAYPHWKASYMRSKREIGL